MSTPYWLRGGSRRFGRWHCTCRCADVASTLGHSHQHPAYVHALSPKMEFLSIFKGEDGKPTFMQNTTSFFSSVQAKGDDLVTSLKKKTADAVQQLSSTQLSTNAPAAASRADGDEDSSASEYGDGGDPAMYADEAPMERKLSSESIDSLPAEEAEKYRSDIGQFVMAMLTENGAGVVTKNAHIFQSYIEHHTGRSAFAKELRKQTDEMKQVPASVLQLLASICNNTLTECGKNDDFSPAASILNVAFRIFQQNVNSAGKVVLTYLYESLKDQMLWQSTRFWNAAVFIALQEERVNRQIVPNTTDDQENLDAEAKLHDSIVYNQLSKFAWRMYSLGLSKDACLDFLRKQVEDTSLSKENQRNLRANVLRFYSSDK
ncbi:conserved hypothetical protein [Echinococcus multilocularis]|uniref:SBF1/SBF2 domain-containing protein n=1 Tax=Echinococcus multilocularis TaxID=6211 RepID=A0A068YGL7_ECHMU|nr:conserved hypothetical protein [Echinococcus multilocularis]